MKRALFIVPFLVVAACTEGDAGTPTFASTPEGSTPPPVVTPLGPPPTPPTAPLGDPIAALKTYQHCTPSGFCWRAPSGFTGNDLRIVWGTAPDDIWLAGREIIHWDGHVWESRSKLPPTPCVDPDEPIAQSFAGTGPNDVWMSAGTAIFHWDGAAWTRVDIREPCMNADGSLAPIFGRLWAASKNDVWSSGDYGVVTRWDGVSWKPIVLPTITDGIDGSPTDPGLVSIWGSAADDVWLVGESWQILHWDGKTFTNHPPIGVGRQIFVKTWGTSKNDVWATGTDGTIIHNDGAGFQKLTPPSTITFETITGTGPNDIWFTGEGTSSAVGPVVHWNGTAFTMENVPGLGRGTWTESPSRMWAVGTDGAVWTRDSKTWTRAVGAEQPSSYNALWGTSADDLYVVGTGIEHWDGKKLSPANATGINGFGVDGTSASNVWVVGALGLTTRFDGTTWTPSAVGDASVRLNAVRAMPDGAAIAVGWGGKIFQRVAGPGGTWTPMASPTTNDLYGIWGPTDDELYAVGDGGTILKLIAGVWTPQASPVTSRIARVHGAPDGTILAVGSLIPSPTNPGQLVAGCVLRLVGGTWVRDTTAPYETLFSVSVESATSAWAAGGHGKVYRWDGATWKAFSSTSLDSIPDVRIDAAHGVSIITDGGGLLQRP